MKRRLILAVAIAIQKLAAGNVDSDVHVDIDFSTRGTRFPSIEERVKLYMSNWYVPPCVDYDEGKIKFEYVSNGNDGWPKVKVYRYSNHPLITDTSTMEIDSIVTADKALLMSDELIQHCARNDFNETTEQESRELELSTRVQFRENMRMYCHDVKYSLLTAWNHIQWEQEDSKEAPPVLLQFGDNKDSHTFGSVNAPLIKKFRSSYTHSRDVEAVTSRECYSAPRDMLKTVHSSERFQPIVWKLATHRHYEKLYEVYQKDTPWHKKRDCAIFRGQLTGSRDGYDKELSDKENCLRLKRCRLVYNHANSSLIDASLTSTRGRLPDVLDGVPLMTRKIDMSDMMQCKGLIMIEGNDVASGLKWALLSQSVVLMPPPKHTSWAMEELLMPWVVSYNLRGCGPEVFLFLTLFYSIYLHLALYSFGRNGRRCRRENAMDC